MRLISDQMGQPFLTDWKCVTWLHAHLLERGNGLHATSQAWFSGYVQKEAMGFMVKVRAVPDFDRDDVVQCLEVVFRRRGPKKYRERTIYIRLMKSQRRLQHPRDWRIAFGGLTQSSPRRRHRKLGLLALARDIYWSKNVPPEDLLAQLIIAMIQLRVLRTPKAPLKDEPREWLSEYVKKYQIRFKNQGSKRDNKFTRSSVAGIVAGILITRWSFPEDFRAFRMYVKALITPTLLQHVGPMIKLYPDPIIVRSAPTGQASMTVIAAAGSLRRSKSYIHRLIKSGAIRTLGPSGLIANSEIVRVKGILAARAKWQKHVRALQASGKSTQAARKAVYRMHGPMPKIPPYIFSSAQANLS